MSESRQVMSQERAAHLVYEALPVPLCLVDSNGSLVAMNPAAERFWHMRLHEVAGAPAGDVLGIQAEDSGRGEDPLTHAASGSVERIPCRITGRDGQTHAAQVVGSRLHSEDCQYTVLGVVAVQAMDSVADPPLWALTDPVTRLGNRHRLERGFARWNTSGGAVVFLDLDDLKRANDLYGHRVGDQALALVGRVLREALPPHGLAIRYGGDEFLVLLPEPDAAAADSWAEGVQHAARARGSQVLPLPPELSYGAARFEAGGLETAIRRADDVLYEHKGVLLRAANGSRLVLTKEALHLIQDGSDQPGRFAARFDQAFDGHFRAAYARAVEQAREFVDFAAPQPGSAVVEVGAGSGRIALDGGLAARIGSQGQLLVTDPSDAQLQVARARAEAAGLDWVRFLRAPAEALPVASGTADLVLGAVFLHFTEPVRALCEMARVVRPGGRLALSAALPFEWAPFWDAVFAPVWEEGARYGITERHFAVSEERIRHGLVVAGVVMDRQAIAPEVADFPTENAAQAMIKQTHMVALLLREAPPERQQAMERLVLERIASQWHGYSPQERSWNGRGLSLVARKPG